MKQESNRRQRPQRGKRAPQEQGHLRWVLRTFLLSVSLSAFLSLVSSAALEGAGYFIALAILFFFILLGIGFDIIGVAVTAADPKPFHSMAAHRSPGAREALALLKNAEKVSSFCNDVVGDICGIVSGATAAVIIARLQQSVALGSIVLSTAVTALISGLTIGGKALGKRFAITRAKDVVCLVGQALRILHPEKKKQGSH